MTGERNEMLEDIAWLASADNAAVDIVLGRVGDGLYEKYLTRILLFKLHTLDVPTPCVL